MSEDFIKFLILKVLEQGQLYRIVITDGWEDREPTSSEAIEFATLRIATISETALTEAGIQKRITIEAVDTAGEIYGGHLIRNWDALLQEYALQFSFKVAKGGLEKL